MGGTQLVLGIDAHCAGIAAAPQLLVDKAVGRGVVGFVEGDVAVAVELDLLPGGQLKRGLG
jgi:hypothetical protein